MPRTRRILVGLLAAIAVVASACGSAEASGPPDIQYGRDICVQCGMTINEARFAAAYRLADGTEKLFDDVGGLVLHMRSSGDSIDPTSAWVHDYGNEEWVVAVDASFVPTLSVASPMGHSIVAFATHDAAAAFAADVGGEVIEWDTVLALPAHDGLVGHHHGESTEHDHDG